MTIEVREWPDKDPDETLDFYLDWGLELRADESIVTSEWEAPADPGAPVPTTPDIVVGGRQTVVWFPGGTPGRYQYSNTVGTDKGRTFSRSVILPVTGI